MDLAPTFPELAGVEYPDSFDGKPLMPKRGRSMVSFLSDESAAIHRPDEVIGWEYNDMKAMRVGDY